MTNNLITQCDELAAVLPCPFCGGKAVHREYDDRYPYEAFGLIVDHSADCFLNLLRRQDYTFVAWNTRANLSTIREQAAEIERLRGTVAKLYCASGCSCCRDDTAWEAASNELAKAFDVPLYADASGYDWYSVRDAALNPTGDA